MNTDRQTDTGRGVRGRRWVGEEQIKHWALNLLVVACRGGGEGGGVDEWDLLLRSTEGCPTNLFDKRHLKKK